LNMAKPDTNTPMMQQYNSFKAAYPNAVLFFRLGDFYEMFMDDAKEVSAMLGLTLTSRQGLPMCGVPYHSASTYISRLIKMGHKIAICEQFAPPEGGKSKLFRREVVRLITPGTVVEDALLEPRSASILAVINADIAGWGISSFDASTGDFFATQNINDPDLYQLSALVSRLMPAEILADSSTVRVLKAHGTVFSVPVTEYEFKPSDELPEWTKEAVWENHRSAMKTALMAVNYSKETCPGIKKVFAPFYYEPSNRLQMDESAIKTLELVESPCGDVRKTLWGTLDMCRTPMGSRLLKRWILEPLCDIKTIQARQDLTSFLVSSPESRGSLGTILEQMPDIERLLGRVVNMSVSPRDVAAVRKALLLFPELENLLKSDSFFKHAAEMSLALGSVSDKLMKLKALLNRAVTDDPPAKITDGGVIREGYNGELDELRNVRTNSRRLLNDIETREREKTGIGNLKVGYNTVFGYYIEVSKANSSRVPPYFVRKQTLTNGERYITEELKNLENKILGAEDKTLKLETYLFGEIKEAVLSAIKELKSFAGCAAEMDVFYSFSRSAALYDFTRPELSTGSEIILEESRHPAVERFLPQGTFVPNDLAVGTPDTKLIMLTGPNMSGKSVYLRQAAVAVIMAQMGSFVPAKRASVGIADRIMTRIGAHDKMSLGESTFMVEMKETSSILRLATPRSLILLDEVGRGTSTFDGISIAWAVVEYLCRPERSPRVLFATHYFELTEMADRYEGIKNYNISVKEWTNSAGKREVVFLHRIAPGPADKSYGIHVAQLAGLPDSVVKRAGEILLSLERKDSIKVKVERPNSTPLLPIFQGHPVMDEIKNSDPDSLTPIQALTLVADWKKRLSED